MMMKLKTTKNSQNPHFALSVWWLTSSAQWVDYLSQILSPSVFQDAKIQHQPIHFQFISFEKTQPQLSGFDIEQQLFMVSCDKSENPNKEEITALCW